MLAFISERATKNEAARLPVIFLLITPLLKITTPIPEVSGE
jgi:hypothetical protein